MIDETELERLVNEIFVDSFKVVEFQKRKWNISPFNVDKVRSEVELEITKEYNERVPHTDRIMNDLDQLSVSIRMVGGITREIYETHHFALNAIARTLTDTDRRIAGGIYNLAEDDERSGEINDRFKGMGDREYGESTHCPNIFGNAGEGTLFQRDYSESDMLTTFRIFHQMHRAMHRANLRVATVDLDQLQNRVGELVREREKGREVVNLDLPYDTDTFAYEKVIEFNRAFSDYVTLNVFSIGGRRPRPILVVEFKDPHSKVAQDFMDLQDQHGVPLEVYKREQSTTLRKKGDYTPLDFYDREEIDGGSPQELKLDSTSDSVSTYLVLGNRVPEFFIPMLKSYIQHGAIE
jgi:hypothetical protein